MRGASTAEKDSWQMILKCAGGVLVRKSNSPSISCIIVSDATDEVNANDDVPVLHKDWLIDSLIHQQA